MKVSINEIQTREGRRSLDESHVKELAESIRGIGLINPLTIDRENILIAGLHRLEAVRLPGLTEVECTVSSLEGLQAELAEIDENFVRNDLSAIEYSEMHTAEKLKVDPCTVRRQLQTARNLTPETKEIMKNTDTKISKKAAMKLSRLELDRQKETAALLAAREIKTVEEYTARTEGREQAGIGQEIMEQAGREPEVRGTVEEGVPGVQKTADTE